MIRVGMHMPAELTWRPVLQAAQIAGLEVGDETNQVGLVRELKRKLKSRAPLVNRHLVNFPEQPEELPWFAEAYGAEDPPKKLDEAACLRQGMVLRESHSNVRKSELPTKRKLAMDGAASSASSSAMQQVPPEMVNMFGPMMFAAMAQAAQAAQAGGMPDALGLATGFHGFLRNAKRPKMLGDAPAPAKEVPTHSEEPAPAPVALPVLPAQAASVTAKPPPPLEQEEEAKLLSTLPPLPPVCKRPGMKTPAAKPKPEAAGDSVLPSKPVAKTKPKPKAAHAPKQKAAAKTLPKAESGKKTTVVQCGKGWQVEIRERQSGQKDKHYRAPTGKMYRILGDATAAGFPGE